MSMSVTNNNLLALGTASSLGKHYSRLAVSMHRLSSGLRINGAADDAAGLAIRELMRADISALHQGMRNVNDAISMLQTFDGALGVIDEKLIRMKELAEQAATGTYDSTQRLMIDSEFQAMGSEINRIARATDFNGVKLLCTKMQTWHTNEERFVITDPGSIGAVRLPAGTNGTPALHGADAGNYVNANNPARTISVNLAATKGSRTDTGSLTVQSSSGTTTTYKLGDSDFTMAYVLTSGGQVDKPVIAYNGTNWFMHDTSGNYYIALDPSVPTIISGFQAAANPPKMISFSMDDANGRVNMQNLGTAYPDITALQVDTGNGSYSITRNIIEITGGTADYTASYNQKNQTVTVRLANGGTVSLTLDRPLSDGDVIGFDIHFEGETRTVPVAHHGVDPNQKVKIHFGAENDSAEDYYYIKYANCTMNGLGLSDLDIQTQQEAQEALARIDDALARKDKVRAEIGAMQNRFENTMANVTLQMENLQASESRISDTAIAEEMMEFVKSQILTRSGAAMLAQANILPYMVMRLIR